LKAVAARPFQGVTARAFMDSWKVVIPPAVVAGAIIVYCFALAGY
jgi:hypothetical protein